MKIIKPIDAALEQAVQGALEPKGSIVLPKPTVDLSHNGIIVVAKEAPSALAKDFWTNKKD
jgi:hypothetical protein